MNVRNLDVEKVASIAAAVALVMLTSCADLTARPSVLAQSSSFARIELNGTQFSHVSYRSMPTTTPLGEGTLLWVFIDGDGRPWTNGGREPSSDPTSDHALAMQLAVQGTEPTLYVGRPCYDGGTALNGCTAQWWTSARYSKAVVDSLATAISSFQSISSLGRVVLVGYSGGGTLAVLVAPRLQGVQAVVTVAANLDVDAWTAHHAYLPLTQSLNPADMVERAPWPQIHLRGDHDEVVPK